MKNRLYGHRYDAEHKPDRRIYRHLNNIGLINVTIILIEPYPCNNKLDLELRERYYIAQLKPQLNNNLPARTDDENKQYDAQYNTQYYIDNLEKRKQYNIDHKGAIKERNQQYRIDHKEKINQQQQIRRQRQKNINFIQYMADFMSSIQPKYYDLQELTIFSILH